MCECVQCVSVCSVCVQKESGEPPRSHAVSLGASVSERVSQSEGLRARVSERGSRSEGLTAVQLVLPEAVQGLAVQAPGVRAQGLVPQTGGAGAEEARHPTQSAVT